MVCPNATTVPNLDVVVVVGHSLRSSLDGDILPLQSGELYVASLVMENVVLHEGQVNEITVGSLYEEETLVDTPALQFAG